MRPRRLLRLRLRRRRPFARLLRLRGRRLRRRRATRRRRRGLDVTTRRRARAKRRARLLHDIHRISVEGSNPRRARTRARHSRALRQETLGVPTTIQRRNFQTFGRRQRATTRRRAKRRATTSARPLRRGRETDRGPDRGPDRGTDRVCFFILRRFDSASSRTSFPVFAPRFRSLGRFRRRSVPPSLSVVRVHHLVRLVVVRPRRDAPLVRRAVETKIVREIEVSRTDEGVVVSSSSLTSSCIVVSSSSLTSSCVVVSSSSLTSSCIVVSSSSRLFLLPFLRGGGATGGEQRDDGAASERFKFPAPRAKPRASRVAERSRGVAVVPALGEERGGDARARVDELGVARAIFRVRNQNVVGEDAPRPPLDARRRASREEDVGDVSVVALGE